MKDNKKSWFGNFFSPYVTEEKINMDDWYEDYKNDPDKTISINDCIYNKIIYRCEYYGQTPYSLIVFINTIENLRLEDILIDENGNEYIIKGFEMYSFTQIPEWYPRTTPMLITGTSYNIGNYLTKKDL